MKVSIVAFMLIRSATAFTNAPPCSRAVASDRSCVALNAFDAAVVQSLGNVEIAPEAIVAGVAALAGFAFTAMTIGGNNSVGASASVASSIEKAQPVAMIDVSIPYNAAARHSYNEWSSGKFDEATFQKFQAIYEEKVVAQVTAKKLARDYELEIARLQSIFAKTDADLAILASGEGEVELE